MQHQKRFKNFGFRWKEGIGMPYCPYMYRWVLTLFGYSIRIHNWKRSDDKRAYHDHAWWFWTFVLRGGYEDVTIEGREKLSLFSCKFRPAHHSHYVDVNERGCLSLLITGPPIRKWKFTTLDGKHLKKDKYFKLYGHPPCDEQ